MKLKQYAKLIVESGLNVQPHQIVVIQAPIEAYELVRYISEYAFKRQCEDVIIRYSDEIVEHTRFTYRSVEQWEHYPEHEALMYNMTARQNACYLFLTGEDPELMKDIDAKKIAAFSKAKNEATKECRDGRMFMKNSWCIAAVATQKWAEKVYPKEKNPKEKLWDSIFSICRINENAISNWENHKHSFEHKMNLLNSMQIQSLHYTNSIGTDFKIDLCEDYLFEGGGSTLKNGIYYFPNIPTEELFTSPERTSANGKLVASMPLCYNGNLIEDFWFEFKDGKVTDFGAKTGKDILQSILNIYENARYLGEVALVPYDSPISQTNTLFYETLFDENAACHFALGSSFAECIKDGLTMTKEQLMEKGLNDSLTHVDFMIGTRDLKIVATCKNGDEVTIFEDGNFSSIFK